MIYVINLWYINNMRVIHYRLYSFYMQIMLDIYVLLIIDPYCIQHLT